MSVRDRERKRGVRDDSRSPPFTLLIADIIPVQTSVSEEVNGSEHRLLLFSVIQYFTQTSLSLSVLLFPMMKLLADEIFTAFRACVMVTYLTLGTAEQVCIIQ